MQRTSAAPYSITNLGTLGPSTSPSWAIALNDSGQVVGDAAATSTGPLAFLFTNGAMHEVGTIEGGAVREGLGINAAGHVVGTAEVADGAGRAYLSIDGVVLDLGIPDGEAYAINDADQIVGICPDENNDYHGFLYSNGAVQNLGSLGGGYSEANAINNAGKIAGMALIGNGEGHAFTYFNGVMQDLGTLAGETFSAAYGINDAGQVVGVAKAGLEHHAMLYVNGVMRDLGTLGGGDSEAISINNAGQIVGKAVTAEGDEHACLYSNGSMRDLNDLLPPNSGWVLDAANDINNPGQIAGVGHFNGVERAFLMTPGVNAVPVAAPDSYSVPRKQTLAVRAAGVLSNDTDADGDALTATLKTNVTVGNLTLSSDGSFTYVPPKNFVGTTSFSYEVNDGTVAGNTTTVTIRVIDQGTTPGVFFSSGRADAANNTVSVTFTGALDALVANDPSHYAIEVKRPNKKGSPTLIDGITITSAGYSSGSFTVTLTLQETPPAGTLEKKDEVVVYWTGLKDTAGNSVDGLTSVITAK